MDDLLYYLAQIILNKLQLAGADQAEVVIVRSSTYLLELTKNITNNLYNIGISIFARVAFGKKVGGSSINFALFSDKKFNEELLERFVKEAIKNARLASEDPRFISFAYPKSGSSISVFDPLIETVDESIIIDFLGVIQKKIMELNVKSFHIALELSASKGFILNSNGIDIEDEGTNFSLLTEIQIRDPQIIEGSDVCYGRRLSEIYKCEDISINAYKNAKAAVGGKELKEPIEGELVAYNLVIPDFLWPLSHHVSALEVMEGRSAFSEKIGEAVASKKLTIIDDGTLPIGLSTSKFDGEGLPKQKTVIIHKGVLKNFIYDSYSAYYHGKESTGNAYRTEEDVYPAPWNIVIEPGKHNFDDLISLVDKGFLVNTPPMGSHTIDYISGDFSLTFSYGFYVKNGEISKVISPLTVSGNFFDLLKNVIEVGKDSRILPFGYVPSILFSNVLFR